VISLFIIVLAPFSSRHMEVKDNVLLNILSYLYILMARLINIRGLLRVSGMLGCIVGMVGGLLLGVKMTDILVGLGGLTERIWIR